MIWDAMAKCLVERNINDHPAANSLNPAAMNSAAPSTAGATRLLPVVSQPFDDPETPALVRQISSPN
jgi:hypothetical protein